MSKLKGVELLVFRKMLGTYWKNDPLSLLNLRENVVSGEVFHTNVNQLQPGVAFLYHLKTSVGFLFSKGIEK